MYTKLSLYLTVGGNLDSVGDGGHGRVSPARAAEENLKNDCKIETLILRWQYTSFVKN